MSLALARLFTSTPSVAPRKFALIALLLPALALGAACDAGPMADDDPPAFAAAAADTTHMPPAPGSATGEPGSLTDPNEPCISGCLRRWQICNKENGRRPGAIPDGGACAQTAAACLAACPSDQP